MDDKGRCKLGDFGASRVLEAVMHKESDGSERALVARSPLHSSLCIDDSMTGQVGTPQWCAPELFGQECVSQSSLFAADVYSLAIVMYELITLHRPWLGYAGSDAWEASHTGRRPELTEAKLRAAPGAFVKLTHDCWAQDPAMRPSISAVVKRLMAIHAAEAGSLARENESTAAAVVVAPAPAPDSDILSQSLNGAPPTHLYTIVRV